MSCYHEKMYGVRYGRGECPECAAMLDEMEPEAEFPRPAEPCEAVPDPSSPQPVQGVDLEAMDRAFGDIDTGTGKMVAMGIALMDEVRHLRAARSGVEAITDDEEGEFRSRPIPEAARIIIREAQAYFRPADSQGMVLPVENQLKVWDCLVMAESFLGEAPEGGAA